MPTPLVISAGSVIDILNQTLVDSSGNPVSNPDYSVQPIVFDSTFFTLQEVSAVEKKLISTNKTGDTSYTLTETSTTTGDVSPVSTTYPVSVIGPQPAGVAATVTVIPPTS
jgi:hypothetical protein